MADTSFTHLFINPATLPLALRHLSGDGLVASDADEPELRLVAAWEPTSLCSKRAANSRTLVR